MIKKTIGKHPCLFLLGMMISLLSGLLPVASILILQRMIDTAMNGVFQKAWEYLFQLGCVFLLIRTLQYLLTLVNLRLDKDMTMEEGELLSQKCNRIPYEIYEDGDIYPLINRVMEESTEQKKTVIHALFTAATFFTELVGLSVYMGSVKWWCLVLTLILTIPVWLLTIVGASKEGQFMQANWKWNQRAKLYSHILNSREYIKEEKIFRFYPLISRKWKENATDFQKGKIRSSIKTRNSIGWINFFQYALTILMVGLMVPQVSKGEMTIGVLVSTMDSLWRIIGTSLFTVVGLLGAFASYGAFVGQYQRFLSLPEEDTGSGEILTRIESVEFDHVAYAYPVNGSKDTDKEKRILKDVSFRIEKGEKIALVGENGCGKSTLIKLLIGLISPDEGRILINGKEAASYSLESRRKQISCVFQDFVKYEMTVEENVHIGALWQEETVTPAMKAVDPELLQETGGEKQTLGKLPKDGRDISGGQWQKLALARGLYADGQILVMDEPTAAIDPIAEREIIETMLKVKPEMTKIIVTHRLGAVRSMDRVIVLKDGKVENMGTPDQLRKEDEYYETLYSTQEKWYLA